MDEKRTNLLQHMQICRFCLNPDGNLTNIYDPTHNKKVHVPLPLQLMACAALEVFQNDGMPQLICSDCRSLALQSYSFKTNCKKADDALKLFLATGNLSKPFTKSDFQNYIPKGVKKLRKIREDILPLKRIKIEPEQHSDTDSQSAQIESNDIEENQTVEEIEITPSAQNEFNVKLVTSSTPKINKVEPKPVKIDSHQCTECERAFPLKQLLDSHMKIHSRQTSVENHQKSHENVTKYLCSYCNQSFPIKEHLEVHMKRKHSKRKPFTCEQCGKSFVFKQGLERHIAVHNEEKPHKCTYCEASFTSPIKLTRHITSHAGLRPYPCKLCKRTFLLSHHLTRHMRSHYAAKSNNVQQIGQHKCDICSMSFRRKDSLINHSAIHSMVNLKCVICYTEFNTASAVKEHITTHLSGLPFPCEHCDYSFMTQKQLEEHQVKHAEMEYEEQIEKEVVEEAKALGQITGASDEGEEYEEFGGDHMGRDEDDDEDYQDMEDDITHFSISNVKDSISVRRSRRARKAKQFTDFLKDEVESDPDYDEQQEQSQDNTEVNQSKDMDQEMSQDEEENIIKPIVRVEGTKVYQRKTPVQKPKIIAPVMSNKAKTAPLSQINQPQVTTIENLGITKKELQELPTEKFVDMKIGNKTVRVQKLVLTKEEMKAMAKEGKIRGNTVLIKNPGQLGSNKTFSTATSKLNIQSLLKDSKSNESFNRNQTKTYNKKKTTISEPCNATVVCEDSVIINDIIIDNIDDIQESQTTETIELA